EWRSCRQGRIQFSLQIGVRGQLIAVPLAPRAFPGVEACLTDWLQAHAFSPATDCRGTPVPFASNGGVCWSPAGLYISLPGEGGVIPAVPTGCEAEFMSGRTNGCS